VHGDVTGVQTCALPISAPAAKRASRRPIPNTITAFTILIFFIVSSPYFDL
jgi:hypothetical protein